MLGKTVSLRCGEDVAFIAQAGKILQSIPKDSQTPEGLGLCGKDLSSPEDYFSVS